MLGLPRLSLGELVKGARGGGGGSGAELRKMLRVVVPIAFFIGTDIALTNTSFMYLDSSFIEMVKPSSNILVSACIRKAGCFARGEEGGGTRGVARARGLTPDTLQVYVISVFMGLRGLNGWVIATVLLMMLGQVLIDFNATAFDMKGFVIVLMASTMSACRNVLVECMMQGHSLDRKMNSLELMTNVMPIAGAILFFSAFIPYKSRGRVCDEYSYLCPEGDKAFLSEMELLSGMRERFVAFLGVILIGASMAFVLNLLEFMLLGRLSAMTMQSAGLVKLIFLFIATTTAFNEVISGRQVVGILLGALGVALYNLFNHWEQKQQTPREGAVELMAMARGVRAGQAYAKVEDDVEGGAKR